MHLIYVCDSWKRDEESIVFRLSFQVNAQLVRHLDVAIDFYTRHLVF